jgi:hypothetical protein
VELLLAVCMLPPGPRSTAQQRTACIAATRSTMLMPATEEGGYTARTCKSVLQEASQRYVCVISTRQQAAARQTLQCAVTACT